MITASLGGAALLAGLALAGFGAGLSAWAGVRQNAGLARIGRRALYAAAGAVLLASAALEWALLDHQFELAYVTEHTDRSLPWPLLASAFYGGQEGSLLYWTLVLAVLGSAAVAAACRSGLRLRAYATAVLSALAGFFLAVLVFVASPFDLLEVTPPDGLGLNPILRDGGMLIHPPFLLAGFSSFAIPFAFAMAALLAGRYDAGWLAQTRRVALVAWSLQTVGLTLGMWWAYHVLGWGGYWGWDPVENVALLPWLATTAYVHSAQVQERRGQLRAWNLGLVVGAFLLAIFGTFLVRSGALVSVHTFAVSDVGPWFFGLLAVLLAFSLGVMAWRSGSLRSPRPLESAVSREGAFLLQNFLLVGLVAAVLWGTLLPLLSGLFGAQRVVGPPYYERVSGPLFLVLLLLLAVGPLLPWRRASRGWWRALGWPSAAALLALGALAGAGVRGPGLIVLPVLAAAAVTSVRGLRPWPWVWRHRRVYGAYMAHLGVVVVAVGIAGSHFWQSERTVTLTPGQSVTVAGHTLVYAAFGERPGTVREQFVTLGMGEETLQPARAFYPGMGGQAVSRVAIRSTPLEDVYVVLNDAAADHATVTVFVNPLVTWIWAGAAILVLGILLGNMGSVAPAAVPVRARVAAAAT
ncbi:MAG TPA: cytochrome c-type biogenesis CcmF C-terminal domain-containing protein [Candidatus Dormibacteraeota bacterium]